MNIHTVDYDYVIKSRFITATTNYNYALDNMVPLIDRLEIQRNIQDSKFYTRLESDLIKGCIMPAITLAFVNQDVVFLEDREPLLEFIVNNIHEGFILDGIQRLNTLNRAAQLHPNEFNSNGVLFVNVIICSSMDNLLYRMITLNNGQKPMSARHQIEILAANIFDFSVSDRPIFTEKESRKLKVPVALNRADFIKGYLSFLSNSTNIENQKIIESKLDELIADKILDSNITEDDLEYSQVVRLINRFSENEKLFKWFKNSNNLIGFSVGIRIQFYFLSQQTTNEFENSITLFESAFDAFNFSKIKVGKMRRNLVHFFIKNYSKLHVTHRLELVDVLSQVD